MSGVRINMNFIWKISPKMEIHFPDDWSLIPVQCLLDCFSNVYEAPYGLRPYLVNILHVPTDLSNMFWKLLLEDALVVG